MVKAILGRKLRMTQMYNEQGRRIPLTAIEIGPCPVVQIKTVANDGYDAIQIGFKNTKEKALNKPRLGHLKKADVSPVKVLKEIRVDSVDDYKLGENLDIQMFSEGDKIDISGISKGKGFQGGVKRHNWGGGRKTHGSMFHRRIGAISAGTGQARIFKGKNLPGHMGNVKVTLQNLEIIKIDAENNIVYIKGGVPGPDGGMFYIRETHKKPKKRQAK